MNHRPSSSCHKTRTVRQPPLLPLEVGFSLRHGESVCAPIIMKPWPGLNCLPMANATIEDMLRVKKYLPPGTSFHSSFSFR